MQFLVKKMLKNSGEENKKKMHWSILNTPIWIFLNIQNNLPQKGKMLGISEYRNFKERTSLEINVYFKVCSMIT